MVRNTVVTRSYGSKEIVAVAGANPSKFKQSGIEIFHGAWVDGGAWQLELLAGDKSDSSTRDLFEAAQGADGAGATSTELPINWDNGEVGCAYLGDEDVCGKDIKENEERVLAVTGREFKPQPSEWIDLPLDQVGKFRPQDINITSTIKDSYCPGESFTINIEMEGLARITNADNVTLVNQFNGEETTVSMSDIASDPAQRQASTSFDVSVPKEASPEEEFEMFTIKVGGAEKPITASIGNTIDELSLQEISDISAKCAGDRFGPNITATNAGTCESSMKVEIVNNVNDDVITTNFTSVGTGGQDPGTADYFVSGNIPDVSADKEEIEYEAKLIRDA